MSIEPNITRWPYSFGVGSGRLNLHGPVSWKYYDGLAGYSQTQIAHLLSEFAELHPPIVSATGMQVALDRKDERLLATIKNAWRATGTREEFDGAKLVSVMEMAEVQGRVGRIAFGSKLSALDCALGDLRVERFKSLGRATNPPIDFDMDVLFEWKPVDSQRLVLWAARFGKQEEVVAALWRLHFESRASLTERDNLMSAAEEAGLDSAACLQFLQSEDLKQDVLDSYHHVTHDCGMHWPPFIVLNGPFTDGGPFRDGSNSCIVFRGGASAEAFADAFEQILCETRESNFEGWTAASNNSWGAWTDPWNRNWHESCWWQNSYWQTRNWWSSGTYGRD